MLIWDRVEEEEEEEEEGWSVDRDQSKWCASIITGERYNQRGAPNGWVVKERMLGQTVKIRREIVTQLHITNRSSSPP